jgi:hypothetical protein
MAEDEAIWSLPQPARHRCQRSLKGRNGVRTDQLHQVLAAYRCYRRYQGPDQSPRWAVRIEGSALGSRHHAIPKTAQAWLKIDGTEQLALLTTHRLKFVEQQFQQERIPLITQPVQLAS